MPVQVRVRRRVRATVIEDGQSVSLSANDGQRAAEKLLTKHAVDASYVTENAAHHVRAVHAIGDGLVIFEQCVEPLERVVLIQRSAAIGRPRYADSRTVVKREIPA